MELSALSENIVTVPYSRGGDNDELYVNIDAFTPDFFREVGKRFNAKMKALQTTKKKTKKDEVQFFEDEAQALEVSREIYADMLSSGVLTGWTFTENGVPTAPTKNVLMKLSPRLVTEFWDMCLDAAKTVKKRVESETRETSETMRDGSPVLKVVGQNT